MLPRTHRNALFALFVLLNAITANAIVRTPEMTTRLLALDCETLAGAQQDWMQAMPAPQIFNFHGSVPIVTMEPFARFLIAMGYPEASLRNPDGSLTRSSFASSAELAGTLAWQYERDGLRPILIGHSQGGMLVIRALYELSGEFHDQIAVFDPVAGVAQPRTAIEDPVTRRPLPVVAMQVPFAAAIATGQLARVLLGQWDMIPRLRRIPDSAIDFTGYAIAWDPLAGNGATAEPYVATGTARVRNVLLPATYSHIGVPITEHLAAQHATREWIEAYAPGYEPPSLADPALDTRNLLLAADLWFSIRRALVPRGPANVARATLTCGAASTCSRPRCCAGASCIRTTPCMWPSCRGRSTRNGSGRPLPSTFACSD